MHTNILYELGIVLFLGFFTAIIMKKLHQSVITGYIVTGLLIGPNLLGLVKDTSIINTLSELGVVFLMFFLGLEFSLSKLKKVRNSVLFIGTYKISFSLILGFLLGNALGLMDKEQFFLAGIIALSSSGVVAKLLFDMKRTASKESEVLMGVMVYEDFIAIILLGILSSLAISSTLQFHLISISIIKTVLFYVVFIILGIISMNTFIDKVLMRIDSQELFTALVLGIILLIGAFAVKIGLASAAGAFLLGMLINSYDVEERIHRTISAFKDIFLIVFFISFGMLLDPKQIPSVLWMIAIVVPLSLLFEIIFTTSAAFFCGFSSKSALNIGTSTIARGEYSLIYASMGLSLGAISGQFYQFAGVYVFLMTLFAPFAMKNSVLIKNFFSKLIPSFLKYSLKLVSVTMRPILLPEELSLKIDRKFLFVGTFLFFIIVVVLAFMAKRFIVLVPLCLAGLLTVYQLRKIFINKIKKTEQYFNYHEIHSGPYNLDVIAKSIANLFAGFLGVIVLGAAFWNFGQFILITLMILFIIYLLFISLYVYKMSRLSEKI